MKKLTTEEFKKKYISKFGKKYDLSQVNYNGNKIPIKIICDKHGLFEMRPNDLLMGSGCPMCGGTKKMTTTTFIQKANYVHNNFFTYDRTVFINSNTKVIITCPIHGDFEQKANNHLSGQNCPLCRKENITHKISTLEKVNKSTCKYDTETFKNKCVETYGDKFLLDKVDYVNNRTKVIIGCKEHGDFEITPNHFLSGRGCPLCSRNKQLTTDGFVNKAINVHGDFFIYDRTNYQSTHKKVIITCPIHGDFEQMPSNHLKGKGCPLCKSSHLETEIRNLLTENNIRFKEQYKNLWLGLQSLDFYLPDYKIGIECQGIQHFDSIEFFGGDDGLKDNLGRDNKKREKCERNGVKLLYYSNIKERYFPYDVITSKDDLLKEIK